VFAPLLLMRAPLLLVAVLLALLAGAPRPALAQPASAPHIESAEQAFARGLRSYTAGQYGAAYDAFMRAATEYGFNQRTTAAHLMAGKARYAGGDFEAAASTMTSLVSAYPGSRYVEEARRVRREATARLDERAAPATTDLGVILPLSERDAVFSQALFNGVRLAVDAHNAAHPDRPVRIVFRDSRGEAIAAADAVESLARAGVAAVIGPLYSEEAIAAGGAAERTRLMLVAPMATDERVSDGRRYVFQTNPTFEVRGRAMARYAADQGVRRVGIVAARGTLAETLAEAFQSEAARRGLAVSFSERLPGDEAWFQLAERVGADRLGAVDAVYFPITGASADDHAAAALRGLDLALGEGATRPRILANDEWQGLSASRARAARYEAVLAADFYDGARSPRQAAFEQSYRALSTASPDRLAFAGYDAASWLLAALTARRGEEPLAEAARQSAPFDGVGQRIEFGGAQVNQALHLLRFRGEDLERIGSVSARQ
jgi:branched-chain amino acid transport system substrate-binding protein